MGAYEDLKEGLLTEGQAEERQYVITEFNLPGILVDGVGEVIEKVGDERL